MHNRKLLATAKRSSEISFLNIKFDEECSTLFRSLEEKLRNVNAVHFIGNTRVSQEFSKLFEGKTIPYLCFKCDEELDDKVLGSFKARIWVIKRASQPKITDDLLLLHWANDPPREVQLLSETSITASGIFNFLQNVFRSTEDSSRSMYTFVLDCLAEEQLLFQLRLFYSVQKMPGSRYFVRKVVDANNGTFKNIYLTIKRATEVSDPERNLADDLAYMKMFRNTESSTSSIYSLDNIQRASRTASELSAEEKMHQKHRVRKILDSLRAVDNNSLYMISEEDGDEEERELRQIQGQRDIVNIENGIIATAAAINIISRRGNHLSRHNNLISCSLFLILGFISFALVGFAAD